MRILLDWFFLFIFLIINFFTLKSTTTKTSENSINLTSTSTTHHDRAMFGPLWASKQIAEKSTKMANNGKKRVEKDADDENKKEENVVSSRFPLAHEKVCLLKC